MQTAADVFTNNPDASNLQILRNDWFTSYVSAQTATLYNFGPAADVFLRSSVNNFPLDVDAINANIQSGNYDLNMPDAYDKGFPALDYLLYGIGADDTEILSKYTTDPNAAKYIQYLTDIVEDIVTRVDDALKGWAEDGYDATFNTNTGTAAGTSLSLLVNQFNESYELIKRDKIGIPSGVLTLGFTNPNKVEAFYSGRSLELATAALEASEQFYLGGSGMGLDDLVTTIGVMKNDQPLNDVIKAQFTAAKNALAALTGKLSDEVTDNTSTVETAYNELSKQVVNIKTDMPSVMCVSITYVDNPSDSD
jgi:predicted lipoprotein